MRQNFCKILYMGLLATLFIAGCGVALEKKSDAEIRATLQLPPSRGNPPRVCQVLEHPSWWGPRTFRIAEQETTRLGLDGCNPNPMTCTSFFCTAR